MTLGCPASRGGSREGVIPRNAWQKHVAGWFPSWLPPLCNNVLLWRGGVGVKMTEDAVLIATVAKFRAMVFATRRQDSGTKRNGQNNQV